MTRDDDADTNDRHVMREALWSLERAAERFRAILPAVHITHGAARDLIEDADEMADQLHALTRAHQPVEDDVAAALREYDGDAPALEQDLDRLMGDS